MKWLEVLEIAFWISSISLMIYGFFIEPIPSSYGILGSALAVIAAFVTYLREKLKK